MMLTLKHLFRGTSTVRRGIQDKEYFSERTDVSSTVRYPHVKLPMPDNSRNQLHVEIDDCIVCDLCAKICPVDCIDIISIKATEEIGKTSDGSSKRLYAAKFDIDMAKCMFCGLCTIVCPTECIIMTDEYDVSLNSVEAMNYHFSTMSEEEAEQKRQELAIAETQKKAAKEAAMAEAKRKAEEEAKQNEKGAEGNA